MIIYVTPFSRTLTAMENVDLLRLWRVNYFLCVTACTFMLSGCVLSLNEEGRLLLSWKESLEYVDHYLGDWNASDATPCLWNGVSCTQGSISAINFSNFLSLAGPIAQQTFGTFANLTALDVGNANLSGLFPRDIVNCSKLVTLNLSWSYIGGEVPADISKLKQLQVLDLSYAYFNGTISNSSIGELQELQALCLHNNYFVGPVPESISSLTKLQKLTLGLNLWTGTLPSGIFKLLNLRVCWLGDDLLDAVPVSDLSSWENMENLRLHNVNFPQGPFPAGVEKMTQLTVLQLSGCNLTGPIPSFLQKLTHLEIINLDKNTLSGDIPDMFGSMANLTDFSVQVNQLSGPLPASLCQCTKLTVLFVYSNRLQGEIPYNLGTKCIFKWVDLGSNRLEGLIPPNLCRGNQLWSLSAKSNRFTGPIPEEYGNCTNLAYFSVANNSLSGSLRMLARSNSSLQLLDFSHNEFTGDIPAQVNSGHLGELRVLMLSHNQLQGRIPAWIGDLKQAQVLDLSHNNLTGSIPTNFDNLNGFKVSAMKDVNESGPYDILLGPRAYSLDLDLTIGGVPSTRSYILRTTTSMDLSSNALNGSILKTLEKLVSMKYLIFSDNILEGEIPLGIMNLKDLEILYLSQNKLTGAIPSDLSSSVSKFNVSFNNLSGVIPKGGQFDTFTNTSYVPGNDGLCGEVINESCGVTHQYPSPQPISDMEMNEFRLSDIMSMTGFAVGAGIGFLSVFFTSLAWNPARLFVFGSSKIRPIGETQPYGVFNLPT